MARQSGLGRGLGALIPPSVTSASGGEGDNAAGSALFRELPISSIRPNAFQPRQGFADDELDALTASIRELGVLQPILVRPTSDGQYELIAGERRWRASQRAGLTLIPAVIRVTEDTQALEQALVENLHRVDLNAIEEAAAYQQLIDDFSLTHDDVARRVGRSRAAVTNTLRLLNLTPSIQRLIMDGQISAGHARALLGTSDKAFQETQARRVVAVWPAPVTTAVVELHHLFQREPAAVVEVGLRQRDVAQGGDFKRTVYRDLGHPCRRLG